MTQIELEDYYGNTICIFNIEEEDESTYLSYFTRTGYDIADTEEEDNYTKIRLQSTIQVQL